MIPITGPPTNTGQEPQADLDQTKVWLDVLRRQVEENVTAISGSLTGLSFTPAGYVKATGSAFTNQAVPIPVADGGTGAVTHTSGSYLKGAGTGAITSQAPPFPAGHIASGTPAAGKYPDGGTDPATWTVLPGAGARIIYKNTSDLSFQSTTTETTLLNSALTITGNKFKASGAAYAIRVRAQGRHSVTNAETITLRLKYGGTTVATVVVDQPAAVTDKEWRYEGEIRIHYTDGNQIGVAYVVIQQSTVVPGTTSVGRGTGTVDNTADKTLDLTAQMSQAAGTDVWKTDHLTVELIPDGAQ